LLQMVWMRFRGTLWWNFSIILRAVY
jgi:hypothetical protein